MLGREIDRSGVPGAAASLHRPQYGGRRPKPCERSVKQLAMRAGESKLSRVTCSGRRLDARPFPIDEGDEVQRRAAPRSSAPLVARRCPGQVLPSSKLPAKFFRARARSRPVRGEGQRSVRFGGRGRFRRGLTIGLPAGGPADILPAPASSRGVRNAQIRAVRLAALAVRRHRLDPEAWHERRGSM